MSGSKWLEKGLQPQRIGIMEGSTYDPYGDPYGSVSALHSVAWRQKLMNCCRPGQSGKQSSGEREERYRTETLKAGKLRETREDSQGQSARG